MKSVDLAVATSRRAPIHVQRQAQFLEALAWALCTSLTLLQSALRETETTAPGKMAVLDLKRARRAPGDKTATARLMPAGDADQVRYGRYCRVGT
jgi:hypothetical protein